MTRGAVSRPRPVRVRAVTTVALLGVLLVGVVAFGSAHVAEAVDTTVTVGATTGLVDGQVVAVSATGMPAASTYLVVECGPQAVTLLSGGWPNGNRNPMDGCESQGSKVLFAHDDGAPTGNLTIRAVLNAAIGPIDCRVDACFIAFFSLQGGATLHLVDITFAADACAAPGSCATGVRPGVAGRDTADPAKPSGAPPVLSTATASSPVTVSRDASVAGDLSAIGSETGPATGPFAQPAPPAAPVGGEGMVRLMLAAPGTDWGMNQPTAVVVDVSVDGGTTQQMVLFRGATSFVYAGFTGPLTTGAHQVTVAVNSAQSVTRGAPANVDVHDVQLQVVTPDNPSYLAFAHAPVMYGRSTSAQHDTPLIPYAASSPTGGGATRLSYTEVFTHEDAGTAFIPFMESAAWGRMTDIESFFSVTVGSTGTLSNATFFSGQVPDDYPDTQNAIDEVDVPFTGAWAGTHPIVRDATGNNDFSQVGTTPFRFQQVPVAAPAPGSPREAVMDANPWTYRVMGDEIARWYTNFTTDPALPEQGDARQYAYVELHTTGSGVGSIGVDIQLEGDPTWYANDFGSGFDLTSTGGARTVVKLPLDWLSYGIAAVRLRVFPTSATSSVGVTGLTIGGLDSGWIYSTVAVPQPSVLDGFLFVPPTTTSTTTSSTSTSTPTSTSSSTSTPTPAPSTVPSPTGAPVSGIAPAATPRPSSEAPTDAMPAVAQDATPTYTG